MNTIMQSQSLFQANLQSSVAAIARSGIFASDSPVMRSFANHERLLDGALGLQYKTVPGKPGKPAVYEPDKAPEKFLAHLRRLGWIERDARHHYGLTALGRALLKAEAMADSDDEDGSVVVLAPEDQNLGYGQVLGRIADSGDAVIVDPYLGTQELMDLLAHTSASRFLIGTKVPKGRVTELVVQIKFAPPNDVGIVRELRRAEFHDRYLIGEHNVHMLTGSLNGVSKSSMALLVEVTDVAADAIRAHVDQLWANAEVVTTGLTLEDVTNLELEASADEPRERGVVEVDGKYLHDGCEVKHRSEQAARNCSKGS